MQKIIEDLKTMQRIDYVPDSLGYEVLDKAIKMFTLLAELEKTTPTLRLVKNTGAVSGTVTVGSPDIHWEKHL